MRNRFNLIPILFLIVFCWTLTAFAAAITSSPDSGDVFEINNATPGTSKVGLGTRLRGVLQTGVDAITATGNVDIDESTAVTTFVSGGVGLGTYDTLDSGYPNQIKTLVLITDGGADVTVTPTTKTGFTSITLNDAKDSVTLRYVNDTIGWVVSGNNGVTVN